MIELSKGGAYLVDGVDVIEESVAQQGALAARLGTDAPSKEEAAKNTIAYSILESHNTSGNMDKLKVKFDKMTSHDITFVGIIQTARASGLEKFPIPYVLTNCHNSLCAVGGTINEDDHMFGLTCAKKYGGIYVPPHQAVIHQFAREMLAESGKMILGSDSHTRYGALGTMAVGEGGPELVKQLLGKTYDINMPGDGSAREQAASCQKVLGGWANIANEYATKRYRSNLINWGMLPFIVDKGELPFANGDYIFIPEITKAVKEKASTIQAFVVNKDMKPFELKMDELTDDERQIILDGCLINFYRNSR